MTVLDAAWAAFDARQEHGERSREYRRSLRVLELVSDLRHAPGPKHCGLCGEQGHNARGCPVLDGIDSGEAA